MLTTIAAEVKTAYAGAAMLTPASASVPMSLPTIMPSITDCRLKKTRPTAPGTAYFAISGPISPVLRSFSVFIVG